jgi:hypothetical protein
MNIQTAVLIFVITFLILTAARQALFHFSRPSRVTVKLTGMGDVMHSNVVGRQASTSCGLGANGPRLQIWFPFLSALEKIAY